MSWYKEPDYTGASAQEYVDRYGNRPEDAGSLEGIQEVLADIGMAPVVGEPADLLNALLYGMQGQGKEAGFSILSMLPYIGGLTRPVRKALRPVEKAPKKLVDAFRPVRKEDLPSGIVDAMKSKWSPGAKAVNRAGIEDESLRALRKREYEYSKEGQGDFFMKLLDGLFESFKDKEF